MFTIYFNLWLALNFTLSWKLGAEARQVELEKIITKWNGFLPIVQEMPKDESITEKIKVFMDTVRKIGVLG